DRGRELIATGKTPARPRQDQGTGKGATMTRTEPGQPLVTLDGARKSFGAIRALDAVTLTIDRGECLALVGHNGAGKSTLVNLINGALAPSGGSVSYGLPDGQVVTGGAGMRAAG